METVMQDTFKSRRPMISIPPDPELMRRLYDGLAAELEHPLADYARR